MFGSERADRRICGRQIHTQKKRMKHFAHILKMAGRKTQALFKRRSERPAQPLHTQPLHTMISYADCLMGRAAVPKDAAGKLLFQFLMVGGMVTIMGTFNGMRHSGWDFFATHHWIFPLIACVAMFLRLAVVGKLVDRLAPKLVFAHMHGIAATAAMTVLNVALMAPLMTSVTTLLLYGTQNYWYNVVDNLFISMAVSFFVNMFVVGPIVKLVYNNMLNSERGLRWLCWAERTAMPWMAIFNS